MPHIASRRFSRFARTLAVLLVVATMSCWERDADLVVSATQLDFGTQYERSAITVRNGGTDRLLTAGVTALEYSFSSDAAWLTVDPASGRCGEGEENTHTVIVNRDLLAVGSNSATITVSSNGGTATILVRAHRDGAVCSDAPTAPADPAPNDGSTGVGLNVDLVWNGGDSQCPGVGVSYDVYFGTTAPAPFRHNNGSSKTWDPGTLDDETVYYWRIVAKDAGGETPGPEWSFTTAAAVCATPPNAPTAPAPANAAINVDTDQNLSWTGGVSQCPGLTATYDLYFGTTSPPPFHHNNASAKTWDPGTLDDETTYYWRIVAKDANGSTSSPEWGFTTAAPVCATPPSAPASPAPANNATGVGIDQNLSWTGGASQCAGLTATYDVYFGTTSPPPFDHDNGTVKAWDPGTLDHETRYYWRIVAKDANGSTSSSTWSFTTAAAVCATPPSAPGGPAPANAAINVSVDQNLAWTGGVSQCPGLTATYDVYFGTTSPPPFDHDNGTSKTWDPGTLDHETTYYWRIVARDANGSTSSPEWGFTTVAAVCTTPPSTPTGPTPANAATNVSVDQNLAWTGGVSPCPGLTATYDVYFGTTSPPPFDHDNGTVKAWDPGTLDFETTYYWRIVAKDANGSTSSVAWSFTTAAPVCVTPPSAPTGPTPANNATAVGIDQNLSWTGGVSQCPGLTATYDVYFGTTSPPPFHHNNGSAKTWDPGTLDFETTYYWRIVAKDANGSTSSPEWSFTTIDSCLTAPTEACLPFPAPGLTDVTVNMNVAWGCGVSTCPGLTATYEVYFDTVSTPALAGTTPEKTWNPGTLEYSTTYYWQIASRDENGVTLGPVWSFVTEEPCLDPPTVPCTPNPSDGRVNVNENANLAWGCGDSQCEGMTVTYDVYFGTNPLPGDAEYLGNTAAKAWNLAQLAKATTYYWRVVAIDENGATPGPVWSFTTRN